MSRDPANRGSAPSAGGFRFDSVFAQASFQFCGHVDEYLIRHTRHLCLMYCQPRFGEHRHVIRRYEEGRLTEEREIRSSQGRFAYYWLWFVHHNLELWRFARRRAGTLVIVGHPVGCFGMTISRRLLRLRYSYGIGDYFPSRSPVIRAYERLKRFYSRRADCSYFLTDAINLKVNGRILDDDSHRTVMWGLRPFPDCAVPRTGSRRILFVGLMREGQGIGELLSFLAAHSGYSLALVGVAANGYEREIARLVGDLRLGGRVYFANRFHSERELREIAKTCFCGVALYDTGADNFTHYADPGKVKAYAELGLPVVMTRISETAGFVGRFGAGRVIGSPSELGAALDDIAGRPADYARGVAAFAEHFEYERYYGERYVGWRDGWR